MRPSAGAVVIFVFIMRIYIVIIIGSYISSIDKARIYTRGLPVAREIERASHPPMMHATTEAAISYIASISIVRVYLYIEIRL